MGKLLSCTLGREVSRKEIGKEPEGGKCVCNMEGTENAEESAVFRGNSDFSLRLMGGAPPLTPWAATPLGCRSSTLGENDRTRVFVLGGLSPGLVPCGASTYDVSLAFQVAHLKCTEGLFGRYSSESDRNVPKPVAASRRRIAGRFAV